MAEHLRVSAAKAQNVLGGRGRRGKRNVLCVGQEAKMRQEGAARQEKDAERERERETASALKIISVKHGPQFAYQTRALVGIVSGRRRRMRRRSRGNSELRAARTSAPLA